MTDYEVEFVGTGERITVPDTETILKCCLETGVAQEYSCRVGMCLACSAEILEGEVEQAVSIARGLTEEEAEQYALTCMARPASDLRIKRGVYPPSIEDRTENVSETGDDAPADD